MLLIIMKKMRKWCEKLPHSPARQGTEVMCDVETGISQGKLLLSAGLRLLKMSPNKPIKSIALDFTVKNLYL